MGIFRLNLGIGNGYLWATLGNESGNLRELQHIALANSCTERGHGCILHRQGFLNSRELGRSRFIFALVADTYLRVVSAANERVK